MNVHTSVYEPGLADTVVPVPEYLRNTLAVLYTCMLYMLHICDIPSYTKKFSFNNYNTGLDVFKIMRVMCIKNVPFDFASPPRSFFLKFQLVPQLVLDFKENLKKTFHHGF